MTRLAVRPLTSHTGAEVHGVDLAAPLGDDEVRAISSALHRWKVLFFRDQRLDHASHVAFARQFGEPTWAHPFEPEPPDDHPQILTVDEQAQARRYQGSPRQRQQELPYSSTRGWHTDVTAAVNPPAASILRAEVVPAYGGDTTFTNLAAAYELLSPRVRVWVDDLRAEHRFRPQYQVANAGSSTDHLVSIHPVVRVHPETGERALFVNPGFTERILEVNATESAWLLDYLFETITRRELTVRFKWEPGSVAFWDNRATAHLGPVDIDLAATRRVLHRVTLVGDVPVGPDGRESTSVHGAPFTAERYVLG